jgi:hypothetical protein
MSAALTPPELLDAALEHIESASIRRWVAADRTTWLRIVTEWQDARGGGFASPVLRLASYITCSAIGA